MIFEGETFCVIYFNNCEKKINKKIGQPVYYFLEVLKNTKPIYLVIFYIIK